MAGFDDPAFYGDRCAAVYDDHHGRMDPGPAVEFLAGLAGDGRVLELAIGTGRVALPLAARGIAVEGVAIRYSWPAELDLMADRAGLRLTERHADWDRRPFTSASDGHVSVYRRA